MGVDRRRGRHVARLQGRLVVEPRPLTLREQVETFERGVPMSELSMRLAELENDIEEWVVAFSADTVPGDGSTPAGGSASMSDVLDRLDDVLARINDLDDRVDEICQNVPVC